MSNHKETIRKYFIIELLFHLFPALQEKKILNNLLFCASQFSRLTLATSGWRFKRTLFIALFCLVLAEATLLPLLRNLALRVQNPSCLFSTIQQESLQPFFCGFGGYLSRSQSLMCGRKFFFPELVYLEISTF